MTTRTNTRLASHNHCKGQGRTPSIYPSRQETGAVSSFVYGWMMRRDHPSQATAAAAAPPPPPPPPPHAPRHVQDKRGCHLGRSRAATPFTAPATDRQSSKQVRCTVYGLRSTHERRKRPPTISLNGCISPPLLVSCDKEKYRGSNKKRRGSSVCTGLCGNQWKSQRL